ncbi:MAG: T9SS type A sorting domain-containing protein, partial [Bacteroidales bacterium]|nr:T9SS type A sorting domain-containing protein [Bacteroidales bacterium]
GNTQNPRTITVTQDIAFSAEFEGIKYKLSLSVNDATRGIFSGNGEYSINTAVTITASPNSGYRFVGWSDGNKNSARTITVTKDIALVAIFGIESMYYVYAAPNNTTMGSVTGSNDYEKKSLVEAVHKAEYSANSVATITAIPNPGYRFVRWNDGSTTNPLNFTVTDDHIITAIFDENTGITDREASDISVYPNPARDNITVVLPENIHQAVFTLYDIQGKVLLQQEISNQDVISVNTFAKGIYIYNVTTDKEKHVGKLMIDN